MRSDALLQEVFLMTQKTQEAVDATLSLTDRCIKEIFQHSRDGFVLIDANGRILNANPAYCAMLGYSLEELQALRDFHEITPGRWHEFEATEIWGKCLLVVGYSGLFKKEYIHKDGTIFPVELQYYLVRRDDGEIDYIWAVVRDITEREQVEEKFLMSEERFRALFQGAPAGMVLVDMQYRFVAENATYREIIGYDENEIRHLRIQDITHPDDLSENLRLQESLARGEIQKYQFEKRFLRKNGEIRWGFLTACLLRDLAGVPMGFLGHVIDITERKRLEAELKDTTAILKAAMDCSPAGIAVVEAKSGKPMYLNNYAQAVRGLGKEPRSSGGWMNDYVDMEQVRHIDGTPYKEDEIALVRAIKYGETNNQYAIIKTLDDEERIIWAHAAPIKNDKGEIIAGIAIFPDVTDLKRIEKEKTKLEEQFYHAQKMESIGRLAGGVAHDFNNMLSVIIGHIEIAKEQVDKYTSLYADLEEIQKAAMRSAELTQQLLAFARKQTITPKIIDLNEAIEGMLKMLRRIIGEDIKLIWIPYKDLWLVKMDTSQIDQILANFCVNARDSISGAGRISIETRNISLDRDYCSTHGGFKPGDYVVLVVSDTGCGMEPEILSHIFEPFFTTKKTGQGTGLGLSTIYGIVRQNEGFINAYSEPNRGTTFTIYIPRHHAKVESLPESVHVVPIECGHETILLVEDEPAILNIITVMLESSGYVVLVANAVGEAIRIAKTHTSYIDLLITDVIMPEMNGRDLAKELSSIHPRIKHLFMSGYTADVIANQGVLDEGVHFIQKPFTKKDITAKIRQILDEELW